MVICSQVGRRVGYWGMVADDLSGKVDEEDGKFEGNTVLSASIYQLARHL